MHIVKHYKKSLLIVLSCIAIIFYFSSAAVAHGFTCPCTVWSSTTTPGTLDQNDPNAVEVGVKFTADTTGQIKGIRFYKGSTNTGTHVGNLWDANGNKLASVTFTNETSSGWQEADFATPVSITPNTTYVASYYAPNGKYAADNNYFASAGVDNSPLHLASSSAVSGGNGVYTYGSDVFPTSTFQASNYWVDVVFQDTPAPTPTPTPTPAPLNGGPILLLTSTSNNFTKYYTEILHAEGLNEFDTIDIANVSEPDIAKYDVVLLGQTSLTSSQVTMLTTYVNGGGTLIAMRPDKQLAGLLGLADANSTLSDGYIYVNTNNGPGVGITNQTIQYHDTADLYNVRGATSIAALYSGPATPSAFPAVTTNSVGTSGGHAIAFTYDLAKSVAYTRQGNPAWAGQSRDGNSPPVRADNLFYPNYVNLDKVQIPQADEQQRLLANIITETDMAKKPLPRFWYLPHGNKAAVIYAVDDHNNVNAYTSNLFDKLASNSASGCSVADWKCFRGTSYFYLGVPLTATQAATYNSEGFELGAHVENNCTDFTSFSNLDQYYVSKLSQFQAAYPGLPAQTTHRFHCIVWSDWLTQAKVELFHGIHLDLNYYYWPPSWVNGRPGMFTGSGIPMHYADTNGSTIDVYQAPTQLVNENGIDYNLDVGTLLANATGSKGYYGVFGTHDDGRDTTFADSVINAAKQYNVPIISSLQALTWLNGRNGSSFSNVTWNSTTKALNFTVNTASGSTGLQAMVPTDSGSNGLLTGITQGSTAVSYSTQTVKGISYAFFDASAGAYTATYGGASTPTPTPTPSIPNDTIWPSSTTPANPSANDPNAVEVGVKFTADTTGQIKGIRFYKGSTNTGTHVGNLWDTNGNKLASVTFTNETSSGWQEADFATPVSITANTTYVASYYAPNGKYAADNNYFSSTGVDSPPLHALSNSAAGGSGNGVYVYGSDSFPTNSFSATNYWVDVVFEPPVTTSIWNNNVTPANPSANDSSTVEVGVKFTSEVSGLATGIKFYKGTTNTGTHIGNLWDANGNKLASVTFTNETSSGWQEADFATPATISANTTYVVSYFSPNGHYAADTNYFLGSYDSIPLHAPSSITGGGNGVYALGSDSFPTSTFKANNYWVDILIKHY